MTTDMTTLQEERRRARNRRSAPPPGRALLAALALLSCIYNLGAAWACHRASLHEDPDHIGLSISVYAWAGSILSFMGFMGIVTNRSILITSYAHFLLLDTFASFITRLLFVHFALEGLDESRPCNTYSTSMPSASSDLDDTADRFGHDLVATMHGGRQYAEGRYQFQQLRDAGIHSTDSCRVALNALRIILLVALVGLTVAQGIVAAAMRRYGKELERKADEAKRLRNFTIRSSYSLSSDPEKEAVTSWNDL